MVILTTKGGLTMKKNLKLYVWTGVLYDYTSGLAFALATSKEHALKLLSKDLNRDSLAELQRATPEVYTGAHAEYIYGGG
jgi:hypothetical protein